MIEFKPCPFCGYEVELKVKTEKFDGFSYRGKTSQMVYYVKCCVTMEVSSNTIGASLTATESINKLLSKWNTRIDNP